MTNLFTPPEAVATRGLKRVRLPSYSRLAQAVSFNSWSPSRNTNPMPVRCFTISRLVRNFVSMSASISDVCFLWIWILSYSMRS